MNSSERPGNWRFVAAFAICLGLVLYAVFRPEPIPILFTQSDKAGHMVAFTALCLSGRLAFPRIYAVPFWLFCLAAAFLLEWLQHLALPQRFFSYQDIGANFLGVVLAMAILKSLRVLR